MKEQSSLFVKKDMKVSSGEVWKVLIVDDEEDVHTITQTVLSNFSFQNKKLKFLHAYSAKESIEIIKEEKNIALVLLDVVMEEDDSGLKVVKEIRETLQNHLIRIILRTGQPGSAPEEEVIVNYDINDYKEKTELTSKKLFTTLVTALRCYQTLVSLQHGKDGLLLVIDASAELFKIHSLQKFTSGILTQIIPILSLNNDSMYLQVNGFTAKKDDDSFVILAGTGQYDISVGTTKPKIPNDVTQMLVASMEKEQSVFKNNAFVGYVKLNSGIKHFIYVQSTQEIKENDKELIEVFLRNIAVAFENIYFDAQIIKEKDELVSICEDFTYKFHKITQGV